MSELLVEFAATFLPWLVSTAAMCGATYMAIRKDIARAIAAAEKAEESSNHAHVRIDRLQSTLLQQK